jgi:hypothetical protein
MLVEKLSDEKEWEQFVANSSGGTFYHTLAWKRALAGRVKAIEGRSSVRESQ